MPRASWVKPLLDLWVLAEIPMLLRLLIETGIASLELYLTTRGLVHKNCALG